MLESENITNDALENLFESVNAAKAFIGLDLMTEIEKDIVRDAIKIVDNVLEDALIRLMHGDYRRLYG